MSSAAVGARPRSRQGEFLAAGLIGACMLAGFFLVTLGQALPVLLGLLALPAAYFVLRRPELICAFVAFTLYSNANVIGVHFHGIPMAAAAAVPLLLLIPIGKAVLVDRQPILVDRGFAWAFGFFIVQFIGTLFAVRPERAMQALIESATEGLMVYLLIYNAIRSPQVLRQVLIGLALAGAMVGALTSHQQFTGNFESNYGGFAQVDESTFATGELGAEGKVLQKRLGGHLGEKNRYAQVMALLLPIPIFLLISTRSRARKLFHAVCFMLIALGFCLAFSRGQAVGIALMVMIMTACGYFSWRHIAGLGLAVLLIAMAVPQYAARLVTVFEVATMATSSGPGLENSDGATRGRITEMTAAMLAYADHPIIGTGPRMFAYHYADYTKMIGGKLERQLRRAHSLYPGMAATYGTLGLFTYGMMLFVTMRDLVRARRRCEGSEIRLAASATAMLMMLVLFLTSSIFAHEAYIRFYWLLYGVAAATARLGLAHATDRVAPLPSLRRLAVAR